MLQIIHIVLSDSIVIGFRRGVTYSILLFTNIAKKLQKRNSGMLKLKGSPLCFYARTYGADRSRNVPGPLLSYSFVLGCLLLVLV